MSKYFSTNELIASQTARVLGIDNTPSKEIIDHLQQLMEVLDNIREEWGSPIRISSGYRSPKLNKKVGGSNTSAHLRGFAADMIPVNRDMKSFKAFMSDWAKRHTNYDQVLLERSASSEWVHIGLFNNSNQQRHQLKLLNV